MRCPDCNKFVPFDTESEPEVNLEVDAEGNVNGTIRIVNTCGECGQELKEANLDVSIDLSKEFAAHKTEWNGKGEHDLSVETDMTRTDRLETKDRRGNPIKNRRYMKHMYGAEGTITITCSCEDEWSSSVSWNDEVAGSSMEELV